MRSKIAVFVVLLSVPFIQSCRMAEVLAGGERAGTVNRLWPDVPAVPGSKKADLAIPLAARLVIRTMMQGKVNFIAFTTDKTADEIREIYGVTRMTAAGWTAHEEGCIGDSSDSANQGAVCLFVRPNDAKEQGLAIIVAEDAEKDETHIFYVRFDLEPSELREYKRERVSAGH